ncbi:MAG: hypothetical protein QG577_2890, partial [Thermodesulfobacteriota bacterium]|nr:hypothetical protein [Thermodesulfobacteriota bacterium]
LHLENINMNTLQPFVNKRRSDGVKSRTINYSLQVLRRILNLACYEWLDEHNLSWLDKAPRIKLIPQTDRRESNPLTPVEERKLLDALPEHLRIMARFTVNTGCRDQEVCGLKWSYEVEVPEIGRSVVIIPVPRVKDSDDKLLILNDTAWSIVQAQRGKHEEWVFTYEGRRLGRLGVSSWYRALRRAGLNDIRPHDLRHTFGARLRAAGVSLEDRQDLLGHNSNRVTTHYSRPDLEKLVHAANSVNEDSRKIHALVILKKKPLRAVNV